MIVIRYQYAEILDRMKEKYTDLTDRLPEEDGDTEKRLQLLAGEIHALSCQLDWIQNAAFVATASGEALDRHAEQRGLTRHKGKKAVGALYVSVEKPPEYDLVIPVGSVFTTSDGSLNFICTRNATIFRNTGACFVDIEAQYTGSRYNIQRDQITTVVTYFSTGIHVENSSALFMGSDDESDEELRSRIIESYRNPPDGFNAAYYKKLAESVEGVYSANVVEVSQGTGNINIYLAAKSNPAANDTVSRADALIQQHSIPGMTIHVYPAVTDTVSVRVSISIEDGYPSDTAIQETEAAIRQFFSEMRVGQPFITAALGSRIIAVSGVVNYSFSNTTDYTPASSSLILPDTISVTTA